jgi:hypothetical protein
VERQEGIPQEYSGGRFRLEGKKECDTMGKFQFAWEGPYVVSSYVRDGAFRLKYETGVELPHSWNVDNLCKFFP